MSQRVPSKRIEGVYHYQLSSCCDEQGIVTELFEHRFKLGFVPVQWNFSESKQNTLRGMHVHRRHDDYVIVISGRGIIALADLRIASATFGASDIVPVHGEQPIRLEIPPGVAHGFYHFEDCSMLHAASHYWDPADELGCKWNDRGLNLKWPCSEPLLSPRDQLLPPLSELIRDLNQPRGEQLKMPA